MDGEFRAIRDEERAECLRLWETVFESEDSAYFRRYFYGDVEVLPYYTQIAKVDGKIVSAAHIVKRTVACGEMRLTMGGLANVATLPEYRGRGYNRECVLRAIAVMEADAMDFSLLFTGVNDYYAKMGYANLPRPDDTFIIKPDFERQAALFAVRNANAADLPAIFACYDAYNATRPIAVQRNEAYWRDWIGIAADKVPDTLLAATDAENRLVGYINVEDWPENSATAIEEFAVQADLPETAQQNIAFALFQEVASRFHAGGDRELSARIALDAVVQAAAGRVFAERLDGVEGDSMARLLHRENLFRGLSMIWNERWNAAGCPKGVLAFETPYGLTGLDANGPILKIGPTNETAENSVSQSDFFRLLFGFGRLEVLSHSGDSAELLAALFPPQSPIYWSADGF